MVEQKDLDNQNGALGVVYIHMATIRLTGYDS